VVVYFSREVDETAPMAILDATMSREATMDDQPEHLTPDQLAARWHKSAGTLSNWRAQGKGPAYIKLGRTILYPVPSVQEFERAHMRA
jgi:hypothetical protein